MPDYNTNAPQGNDIPQFSQQDFLDNFTILNDIFAENHVPFGNVIEAAQRTTTAAPGVTRITSRNHGLVTTDVITTSHTRGNYHGGQIPWGTSDSSVLFDPGPYSVTVIDEDTFTVPVDSSSFVVYQASQPGDFSVAGRFYGWHTQLNLPDPQSPLIPTFGAQSALYADIPQKRVHPQLFFQNLNGIVQLTSLLNPGVFKETKAGIGLRTPFGYIINFGIVEFNSDGKQYTFPISYTDTASVYSLIATPKKIFPTTPGFFSVTVDNATQFTGYFLSGLSSTKADCYYLAIGQ